MNQILHIFIIINSLHYATGFGTPSSPDIRLVGMPGGGPQTLPAQYVNSFQRWSITGESDGNLSLEALEGASGRLDQNNGFVNPTSTTELWWPSDISNLQVRSTIEILFQSGSPAYASGGLEVRVPPKSSADGIEWKNHGLNSQPLARQWTAFNFVVEPNFRVESFIGRRVEEGSAEPEWEEISAGEASEQMRKALETLGIFLSGIDDTSPLATGFHIVSIPTEVEWTDLPELTEDPKSDDGKMETYALIALGTAEPDSKELLTMESDLVAMTASSILAVQVSQTEPGGESEYLPEAYKPLYI